jgi:hypothetical protein
MPTAATTKGFCELHCQPEYLITHVVELKAARRAAMAAVVHPARLNLAGTTGVRCSLTIASAVDVSANAALAFRANALSREYPPKSACGRMRSMTVASDSSGLLISPPVPVAGVRSD